VFEQGADANQTWAAALAEGHAIEKAHNLAIKVGDQFGRLLRVRGEAFGSERDAAESIMTPGCPWRPPQDGRAYHSSNGISDGGFKLLLCCPRLDILIPEQHESSHRLTTRPTHEHPRAVGQGSAHA
jgi:hypothetical protein